MVDILLTFVKGYAVDIIVFMAMLVTLAVLWKQGKKTTVKRIIYAFVCHAEQQFGSGTGAIKYAAVWSHIYNVLPLAVRLFFTQEELAAYIEEAVKLLKKTLEAGDVNLLTYAQETIRNIEPPKG